MNIVLLHCHYDRGGVTTVVLNQVNSLLRDPKIERIYLVSSGRSSGLPPELMDRVHVLSLESMEYDQEFYDWDATKKRIQDISDDLLGLMRSHRLSADNTLLHWHNHSLGKNTAIPGVVARVAIAGWRSLLQIHDFAEDFRPANYAGIVRAIGAEEPSKVEQYLYPSAPQIHYATLTRSDGNILREWGLPKERVSVLPNCVEVGSVDPCFNEYEKAEALGRVRGAFGLPSDSRWSIYPVRGIRRKNVGEFLLLSQLSDEDQYNAITLRPSSPVEEKSYLRWKSIAESVAPRAVFDAGERSSISFRDNVVASDNVISTSVAEGFGMAYLEPWLFGRGVVARRLNAVLADFEDSGMDFSRCYNSLPVIGDPEWVEDCLKAHQLSFQKAWNRIPDAMRPVATQFGFLGERSGSVRDRIDFALLTPKIQTNFLERCYRDAGFLNAIRNDLPDLMRSLRGSEEHSAIARNVKCISEQFGFDSNKRRLFECYEHLSSTAVEGEVESVDSKHRMIDLVLGRQSFFPCRTEEGL